MSGQKIQIVDSALISAYRFKTLADLLTLQAPFHFRSYGNGQLTTAGFRGTSANHTAILWNGININQPNLGQTDFSTLPVAAFDQISIQHGAAASTLGTDAVGGSILLKSNPDWGQRSLKGFVGQSIDSYQNTQTQAGLNYTVGQGSRWGRMSGKSFWYRGFMRNRFPSTERRGYPIEQSQTLQQGFRQDLFILTNRKNQFAATIWLSDNKLVLAPQDTLAREVTRTQAYRFLTSYETGATTVRAAFIRDIFDYGKGQEYERDPSHTLTDRFLLRIEHEIERTINADRRLAVRFGAESVHIRTRVDGYGGQLITEQRADAYMLMRYRHNSRLITSLNLRQAFVLRYDPPFTPSFGLEYRLLDRPDRKFAWKLSIGRSYRVPTLNERYWERLGNPDLRPERGLNKESGVEYQRIWSEKHTGNVGLTAFHNRVNNWVLWNPERGYRVENLQQVLARGLELQARWNYRAGMWQTGFFGQYALTRTTLERSDNTFSQDIIGKQLVFIPVHTASAQLFCQRKSSRLTLLWQANSRRYYTDDNTKFVNGHALVDLIYEQSFQMAAVRGKAFFQVNNIFDELYLNIKRNAMPGRHFALNIILSLD